MNELCSPYKKRNIPIIQHMSPLVSKAIHERDFETVAKIVFMTTLEVIGVKGLMNTLDHANNFYKRRRDL